MEASASWLLVNWTASQKILRDPRLPFRTVVVMIDLAIDDDVNPVASSDAGCHVNRDSICIVPGNVCPARGRPTLRDRTVKLRTSDHDDLGYHGHPYLLAIHQGVACGFIGFVLCAGKTRWPGTRTPCDSSLLLTHSFRQSCCAHCNSLPGCQEHRRLTLDNVGIRTLPHDSRGVIARGSGRTGWAVQP